MRNDSHNRHSSLRQLDWINFCMADVQMAAAALIAAYLAAGRGWNPARVGIVIAAQNIATMLGQPFAGVWIDRSARKNWLVAGASGIVAIAMLGAGIAATAVAEAAIQAVVGLASAVFAPAIASLSLGMVGRERMPARIARNEAFNHLGKLVLAIAAAFAGARLGLESAFWLFALFGAGGALAASQIRSEDVDDEAARSAHVLGTSDSSGIASPRELLCDRRIPIFLGCIVLFHLGNAAQLQLIGQRLSIRAGNLSGIYMPGCIIVAQLVMIPGALIAGRSAKRLGRKPVFLAAYLVVALRGLLFACVPSTAALLAIEALDGVSAALFGVVWTLIISDLAKGTGRFSLLEGAGGAAWYFGAFSSNLLAGLAANRWGFPAAFLGLAVAACCGFLLFLVWMPETGSEIVTAEDRVARIGSAISVEESQQ